MKGISIYRDLAPLEDELFYSFCTRMHLLGGNLKAGTFSLEMFEHSKRGMQQDFPCSLDSFCKATAYRHGTPEQIIYERTIVPFYLQFNNDKKSMALTQMRSATGTYSLKYKLGLITSAFPADHPLKACPRCIEQDMEARGHTFWHLSHQFPTAHICAVHSVPLLQCVGKNTWRNRFSYLLPELRKDAYITSQKLAVGNESYDSSLRLNLFASELRRNTNAVGLCRSTMASLYHHALLTLYPNPKLSQRVDEAAREFLRFAQQLNGVDFYDRLAPTLGSAISTIRAALNESKNLHPVRHIALLVFFFERYDVFSVVYSSVINVADIPQAPLHSSENNESFKIFKHSECEHAKRPKKIKGELGRAIRADLARGVSKLEIERNRCVSRSSLNRILASDARLKTEWECAVHVRRFSHHKKAWNQAMSHFPNLGAKEIRVKVPQSYQWLYRHEQGWLQSIIEKSVPNKRANNVAVDWLQRDLDLSNEVSLALLCIETQALTSNHLQRMFEIIPRLRVKLEVKGRYPITKKLIATRYRGRNLDLPLPSYLQ